MLIVIICLVIICPTNRNMACLVPLPAKPIRREESLLYIIWNWRQRTSCSHNFVRKGSIWIFPHSGPTHILTILEFLQAPTGCFKKMVQCLFCKFLGNQALNFPIFFFYWKLRSLGKFWIQNHFCVILGSQDICKKLGLFW